MTSDIPSLIEQNWQSITSDTLWRIKSLLDAVRTLIADIKEEEHGDFIITEGDPTIAAGLYTFAVEEYGKYLYLKSLEPIDGKYHIDYTNEFKKHPKKFDRALSNLPKECTLVNLGKKEDPWYHDPNVHDDVIANFETRLRIFYSDFDPNNANKIPKHEPSVDVKLLKIGVQKLWEIVDFEYRKLLSEKNKK